MTRAPDELFAPRYASRPGRRRDVFASDDPHEDAAITIDDYLWLARRQGHVCLIDTGFSARVGQRRQRALLRDPIDSLHLLGVDPAGVQDAVLTHFHYDHAGNFDRLPQARFHVQESEMHYATGAHMAQRTLNAAYEPVDVGALVALVYQGRVQFHNGDAAVTDGISVHHVGGHTMGQQFVRVFTQRGWVVVASDAAHFYEGVMSCRPVRLAFDTGALVRGYDRIRALADSDDHIVPGHDPAVMRSYAAPQPQLDGIAVSLHLAPRAPAAPMNN